jgi:hypothetical protein
MAKVSRRRFALGVEQLVRGVRDLFQEIDQLNLALRDALQVGGDGFKPIGGTTLSAKKDPERQIVRTWYGRLYVPRSARTLEIEEEAEPEEEIDDSEDGTSGRRRKQPPVRLKSRDKVLAIKIVIWEADRKRSEPRLQYAVLGDWLCGSAPGDRRARFAFEVRRRMLRRVLKHIPPTPADAKQRFSTDAKARILGQAKGKGRPLSLRCIGGLKETSLYELDSTNALDRLVRDIRKHWTAVTRRRR